MKKSLSLRISAPPFPWCRVLFPQTPAPHFILVTTHMSALIRSVLNIHPAWSTSSHPFSVPHSALLFLLALITAWHDTFLFIYMPVVCLPRGTWSFMCFAESPEDTEHQHVHVCAQSCLTLFDPRDWSPPASSVHGISQARILEWVAISSSRGSPPTQELNPHLLH